MTYPMMKTSLLGWDVTIDGLCLPVGWRTREDADFVFVYCGRSRSQLVCVLGKNTTVDIMQQAVDEIAREVGR